MSDIQRHTSSGESVRVKLRGVLIHKLTLHLLGVAFMIHGVHPEVILEKFRVKVALLLFGYGLSHFLKVFSE